MSTYIPITYAHIPTTYAHSPITYVIFMDISTTAMGNANKICHLKVYQITLPGYKLKNANSPPQGLGTSEPR